MSELMPLVDELKERLAAFEAEHNDPEALRQLSMFYEEMKRLGLTRKHEYDIPPMDTIGRSVFTILANRRDK